MRVSLNVTDYTRPDGRAGYPPQQRDPAAQEVCRVDGRSSGATRLRRTPLPQVGVNTEPGAERDGPAKTCPRKRGNSTRRSQAIWSCSQPGSTGAVGLFRPVKHEQ